MIRIAHIINPVLVNDTSDLFIAQPITFETMKIAHDFASENVDMTLLSAQYTEDRTLLPKWILPTDDLKRSVLDVSAFKVRRKLPLIKDILDRLYETTSAEYLVYTNVDISLMPYFYTAINKIIDSGYDAFVINRRTISGKYKKNDEIPLMYAEAGEPHIGHDCFVFRRDMYPHFKLGAVCIGINWVGRVLIYNMVCHAYNFKEFKDMHLTFHIGNDKVWRDERYSDYVMHNKNETLKVLSELEKAYGPFNKHSLISHYITDVKELNNSSERIVSRNNLLSRIWGSSVKKPVK